MMDRIGAATGKKTRRHPPRQRLLLSIAFAAALLGFSGCRRPAEATAQAPQPNVSSPTPVAQPPPDLASLASGALAKAAAKSVAVLPFIVRGSDPIGSALADGWGEELIARLGAVPELQTSARTSSFSFRGKPLRPAEIARQLGVAHLVEGELEWVGDAARLRVRLIRAETGAEIWRQEASPGRESWSGAMAPLAEAMAQALGAETRGATPLAVKPEAYEWYVRGRQAWHQGTAEGRDRAEEAFNRAVALAPEFAAAHTALAEVWLVRGQMDDALGFSRSNPAFLPNILAQLKQAIALEPEVAWPHALLGDACAGAWQTEEAKRELETAVRLNPNDATAQLWLAQALATEGRLEDALEGFRRAAALDPLNPGVIGQQGVALVLAARSREALPWLDRALALQPTHVQARCWRAWALLELERMPEAIAEAKRLAAAGGAMPATFAAAVLYRAGQRKEADEAFRQIPAAVKTSVYYLLAVTGRRDDVIALMAPSIARPEELALLIYLSAFDSIRSHPRFREILREAGAGAAHARGQSERTRWRNAKG